MLNPISRNRIRALGAALSMAIAWSSGASAHGGFPRADLIVSQRNDPTHILLRSQVWGLYLSRDSGATWDWICAETFGITSTTANRYTARLMNDGSIVLAGAFKGLERSDADACSWSKDPFFQDPTTCSPSDSCVVNDVVLSDDGTVMTVLTSSGHGATDAGPAGVMTRLWRSTNDGQTWMPLGDPVPESFSSQSVLLSPSDPGRIYLSGKRIDQDSGVLYRTVDGGVTWTSVTAIPITDAGSQTFTARLAGIRANGDGTDTIYYWADYIQDASPTPQPHDLLFVSSDSGQTWSPLFEGTNDLPGLALSPDGASLFVSGPGDGLWKADAAAAAQGQSAFQRVLDAKTWGLEWTDDGLLVGTNDFAADSELSVLSRATLARSATGEAPFDPTLVICEADIPTACASSTTVGQICPNIRDNNETGGGYDKDILSSPRCTGASPDAGTGSGGGGSSDGGTTKPKHKDDSGCRVGDHKRHSSSSAIALFALLAAVIGMRRSRRN